MILDTIHIPQFQDIEIFCTDRKEGNSSGIYDSFNLWIKSWDDESIVLKNRQNLAETLWKNFKNFLYLNQVHAWSVCVLQEWEKYNGEWYDALITNDRENIPIILAADCVPIIVYDDVKKTIWAIHSGWKGTAENIMGNTIASMQNNFDSQLSDIQVVIWPCISQKNYEVDDKVITNFSDNFYNKNKEWWYQINLRAIIQNQAQNFWISEQNIYHIDICTFEREDLFFSARRDGFKSGRFAMGIYFK